MAKLRVGEIEIENGSVRIGGREMTRTTGSCAAAALTTRRPHGVLSALRSLPVPPRVLGWLGALFALAGFAIAVWSGAWQNPIGALLRGGFLIPIGVGVMGAAILKQMLERGDFPVDSIALGDEANEMFRAIKPLLAKPLRHQTVEWLAQRTSMPSDVVVRLLGGLRHSGELEEELDTDTGHYYYYLVQHDSRDLDARLDDINRGRRM